MPRPLIFILCLLPAVVLGVLYIRYRQTPPARWAARVRNRIAELQDRLHALINPSNRQQSPAEKLAAELFLKQRQTVPASALTRYPNIGPKTVEWLGKAGITNLHDAEQHASAFLFKKKIENLGEVREAALKSAVNELVIAERQRFDSGASPEGAEYQRRLANLSAEEQQKAAAQARERFALETCLDRMREFEQSADAINFTSWVLRQPTPVTAELMAREFPAVEVAEAPATAPVTTPPVHAPSTPGTPSAPHPQLPKLQAYCRFALIVAKADNRIAAAERSTIRSFLSAKFGSDTVLMRHIDPQLEQAEANLPTEEAAIADIKRVVPREEWEHLYEFAVHVADAAGERNAKETQYLADLAAALGLDPVAVMKEEPVEVPEAPPKALDIDHRAALDIDASTPITADLVRRKYAMLLDRTGKAKALGGDFAKMAELQETAGKAAAEAFMADLGEPLTKPVPEAPTDLRHNPDLDDLFK